MKNKIKVENNRLSIKGWNFNKRLINEIETWVQIKHNWITNISNIVSNISVYLLS